MFIKRERITGNDKNIILKLTKEGIALKEKAKAIPKLMGSCLNIEYKDYENLKEILERIMQTFS